MESLVVRQSAKREVSQKTLDLFSILPEIPSLFIEHVHNMSYSPQVDLKCLQTGHCFKAEISMAYFYNIQIKIGMNM